MKTQLSRRPNGFTLVELLVVIAIIAVLAGAGFAAGNAAIQKAKKTTAMATCIALESAVNNFYTSGSGDSILIDTKDGGSETISALLGSNTTLNPRAIKFLSVREGKRVGATGGLNGIIFNSTGTLALAIYDPWGGTYKMVIDGDYDEKVQPSQKGAPAIILNGRRVAVWSEGADGKDGGGKIADDVITWNK
jgi:prepilin-type N-terminal cleavage/methylation domain-containing protein